MHYNRRQRRELAKSFGLTSKCDNATWMARVVRSIEAGRQIDQQFKNMVETNIRNSRADREAVILRNDPDAEARLMNNRRLQDEREAKLALRRNRQYSEWLLKHGK